jgi:hypothetical protein
MPVPFGAAIGVGWPERIVTGKKIGAFHDCEQPTARTDSAAFDALSGFDGGDQMAGRGIRL